MPNASSYVRRKRLGLCPRCGVAAEPGHVYCLACLEVMTPGRTLRLQARQRQPPALPDVPGPQIAHCGRWHALRGAPPYTLACCGAVLALREDPGLCPCHAYSPHESGYCTAMPVS